MDGADHTDEHRRNLGDWMNSRRRQLRIKTWNQVAALAGMTSENLRKIRRGEISISENASDGIEEALQWKRGSVEAAILHGVRPIAASPADALNVLPDQDVIPPNWSAAKEQAWSVARVALDNLKLKRELTRQEWLHMSNKYERLDAADRARNPSDSE